MLHPDSVVSSKKILPSRLSEHATTKSGSVVSSANRVPLGSVSSAPMVVSPSDDTQGSSAYSNTATRTKEKDTVTKRVSFVDQAQNSDSDGSGWW